MVPLRYRPVSQGISLLANNGNHTVPAYLLQMVDAQEFLLWSWLIIKRLLFEQELFLQTCFGLRRPNPQVKFDRIKVLSGSSFRNEARLVIESKPIFFITVAGAAYLALERGVEYFIKLWSIKPLEAFDLCRWCCMNRMTEKRTFGTNEATLLICFSCRGLPPMDESVDVLGGGSICVG